MVLIVFRPAEVRHEIVPRRNIRSSFVVLDGPLLFCSINNAQVAQACIVRADDLVLAFPLPVARRNEEADRDRQQYESPSVHTDSAVTPIVAQQLRQARQRLKFPSAPMVLHSPDFPGKLLSIPKLPQAHSRQALSVPLRG